MAFGVLKQGFQHQRYDAKSSNKHLTILVDSESEVFSSTAIAASQLSEVDLEIMPTRIIDTKLIHFLGTILITSNNITLSIILSS